MVYYRNLSAYPLGSAREYPVPGVGALRIRIADNDNVFELEVKHCAIIPSNISLYVQYEIHRWIFIRRPISWRYHRGGIRNK